MTDTLTITLPVYNRTEYIRKALDSAVNQTVRCRILLIDNHSPHEDFKNIVESYHDPLMKYVKTDETVHQDENFNNCIRYCETPFLTILHDDDMLHCQYVEFAQQILASYKNIGGFAVRCHVGEKEWEGINQKTTLTKDIKKVNKAFHYFEILSPFPGVMFRKELGLKLEGFNVPMHPIADIDFWKRLTDISKILMVKQDLAYYRISPNQSTNRLIFDMINKAYVYRLNLIKNSRHNNFISRLTLEKLRLNNIEYFEQTYPDVNYSTEIVNKEKLIKAKKLLKNRWIFRFLNWYQRWLSYSAP
ncbi:MAG: glycosyltransferase family 2 protein [Bacteroidales bacterium]|nr:glycosyltransferase family 2 protein [Bacteroidales bacterium]